MVCSGLVITTYNVAVEDALVSELVIDRCRPEDRGTYICRSAGDHIDIASKKIPKSENQADIQEFK